MDLESLILELFEIKCVKFGEFTLKSGLKSLVYFDLRILVSYPKLMQLASSIFVQKIKDESIDYELLCGVPYGAISLATVVSMDSGKAMIFKRKDAKSHGTKNMIEGVYSPNQRCLVVDDVVTSGISILETIECLRNNGICADNALVLLDREQGGSENLSGHGVRLHSILKTSDILQTLYKHEKISRETFEATTDFLEANKHVPIVKNGFKKEKQLDFEARAKLCTNKVAKQLFEIMASKKTNLCIAADFSDFSELLKTADLLGPHICLLKTHIDILNDFSQENIEKLVDVARKHNFLIFEDRKFADIGNTVKAQCSEGLYKISTWADIINAHSICGQGCIQGLKEACERSSADLGCLLISQLSSSGNLIDDNYSKATVKLAEENSDFVIGFICQKKLSNDPKFIHMTPGIQLNCATDSLGQRYTTPEVCIIENKCDVIIVGRGITSNAKPLETAIKYKQIAYDAYLERIMN